MTQRIAIVMAAGKGTRMKSDLPKVLFPVLGRPMIHYAIDALEAAGVDQIVVVVGYRAEDVKQELAGRPRVKFALQAEQLGTGHAVMMCREYLAGHEGPVLVVAGDSPLMQPASIGALFDEFDRSRPACILGTGYKEDPTGLGRIVRDANRQFVGIVEEKDATPEQKQIREVNLSTYVFDGPDLLAALQQIRADNAQREYYLTDCPGVLLRAGNDVRALDVLQPCEALSINTIEELHAVEQELKRVSLVQRY
jgi:bifunctional UDP-N-acetylglucosamine pyrophosphorylase/glucosamine-1-phosphate N-acetyltransferase/UDP-N-acetylglucosamine pyrophosphorylase